MKADDASRPVDLAQEPDFALGSLQVRPSLREVLVSGEREVLEPRVMQVLVALARRPDQVVSRDQLIDACWADGTASATAHAAATRRNAAGRTSP